MAALCWGYEDIKIENEARKIDCNAEMYTLTHIDECGM